MADERSQKLPHSNISFAKTEAGSATSTSYVAQITVDCRHSTGIKQFYVHNTHATKGVKVIVTGTLDEDTTQALVEAEDPSSTEILETVLAETTVAAGGNKAVTTANPYAYMTIWAAEVTGSDAPTFNVYFRGN